MDEQFNSTLNSNSTKVNNSKETSGTNNAGVTKQFNQSKIKDYLIKLRNSKPQCSGDSPLA